MLKKIRKRKKNKGQSTLEYAVLIVVVMGALLAVSQYIKFGIAGRAKDATDSISDTQFDPDLTVYVKTTNTYSRTNEVSINGSTLSNLLNAETTNTTINMYYM